MPTAIHPLWFLPQPPSLPFEVAGARLRAQGLHGLDSAGDGGVADIKHPIEIEQYGVEAHGPPRTRVGVRETRDPSKGFTVVLK